jgi:DNA-binding protein YbaB
VTEYMGQLADYERAVAARMAQAQELSRQMAEIRGTGEAADGLVQAEVAAGGRVTALRLNPRVMRLDSQALAEEILVAIGRAGEDAARQVQEATPTDAASSWEDLLTGRAMLDPSAPMPPLPDNATFERMIREAAEGGPRSS